MSCDYCCELEGWNVRRGC